MLFKLYRNSEFLHQKDRIEKLQRSVLEIIYRHPFINGGDDNVFYIMTHIENEDDVKSMLQYHNTFFQLKTIEL